MRGGTHAAMGVLAGLLLARSLHASGMEMIGAAVVAGAAALLPDLDHPQATLRQRAGVIGDVAFGMFGHRGVTHSAAAVALITGICWYFLHAIPLWMVIPTGYATHLIGDLVTVQGIPLFAPFSYRRVRLPIVHTGGLVESVVMLCVLGGIGWTLFILRG